MNHRWVGLGLGLGHPAPADAVTQMVRQSNRLVTSVLVPPPVRLTPSPHARIP